MGRHKELPDLQQQALAFEITLPPAGKPEAGPARFIDDAPQGLFVGAQRLDQFLQTNGLTWVVRLRTELEQLDYTELETAYLGGGRKPYHPRTLLGLIVYGILNRSWSLRELEELAIRDVGAWWICGGKRPDHSTIGEFIQRHRTVLTDEFFCTVVQGLIRRLHITPGVVAGDGTVIEAVASRYATLKREAARQAAMTAYTAAAARPRRRPCNRWRPTTRTSWPRWSSGVRRASRRAIRPSTRGWRPPNWRRWCNRARTGSCGRRIGPVCWCT
jgi:transposase